MYFIQYLGCHVRIPSLELVVDPNGLGQPGPPRIPTGGLLNVLVTKSEVAHLTKGR